MVPGEVGRQGKADLQIEPLHSLAEFPIAIVEHTVVDESQVDRPRLEIALVVNGKIDVGAEVPVVSVGLQPQGHLVEELAAGVVDVVPQAGTEHTIPRVDAMPETQSGVSAEAGVVGHEQPEVREQHLVVADGEGHQLDVRQAIVAAERLEADVTGSGLDTGPIVGQRAAGATAACRAARLVRALARI